jgi:hypothetical protein
VRGLVASVDEDFVEINRLLRGLRNRLAVAYEAMHVAAEKADFLNAHADRRHQVGLKRRRQERSKRQ